MILGPLPMVFPYSKQLFLYVIIGVIGGNPMNVYLIIDEYNDNYTLTEKLIVDYILQDSATANICFSKKTGFKGLVI